MSSCGQFVFDFGHFFLFFFMQKTAHTQEMPISTGVPDQKNVLLQTPVTPRLLPVNSKSAFFNFVLVKIISSKVNL